MVVSLDKGTISNEKKALIKFKETDKYETLPIAILVDKQTASAGEIAYIALQGNERVCSFGQPTGGLATGVTGIVIYKDYALGIAGTKIKGNNHVIYEEKPIIPDVQTSNPQEDSMEWLKSLN